MKKLYVLSLLLLCAIATKAAPRFVLVDTCPAFTFSPAALPHATAGTAYSQSLSISAAVAPITYSIGTGALPPGYTLNSSTGTISGSYSGIGNYNFTVSAMDANGCPGTQAYTLVIDCRSMTIVPNVDTLPAGHTSVVYSTTIGVSGGVAPFTYAVTSGSLPPGLTLNTSSGLIYGTPTTLGTYTFTIGVVDHNGCSGSIGTGHPYTIVISCSTANMLQPLSAPICLGSMGGATSGYFHANVSGGVFSGTNVDPSSGYFTPTAPGTYNVTYSYTDGAGCVLTGSQSTTVRSAGTVTVTSSPGSAVCSGQPVTLNASYTWGGAISITGPSGSYYSGVPFTPSSTATYTVYASDFTTGCSNSALYTVTVYPRPTVTTSTSAPGNTVCAGSPITLYGSGAYTYSWSGGVTNSVAFVPSASATYTVTGTNTAGCSATATASITVNPQPTVTTASSATDTICPQAPVTLTGGGASTYSWTGGVTNGVAFNPSTTSTYTVTGTSAAGCSATATITVPVKPQVPLTVSSSAPGNSICPGGSVTLTASGAASYSWSGGVTNGLAFNPASTATYTVTATASTGCSKTATISITVNPSPSITASSNAPSNTICSGGAITLSGGGGSTYSWNGGVTNGIAFNPTTSATYTVTGTSASGCQNTATIAVTVRPLPNISAGTSAGSVCAGSAVTLNQSGDASAYSWSGGVTAGTAFVPTATTTYTLTGTQPFPGCTAISTVTVTVNPLPIVTITGASSVCSGGSITLAGNGANSYTWNNGITDNVAFVPTATTTYVITGTDTTTGCSNTASSTVTVNPLPTVVANTTASAVCAGSAVTLTGSGATTYTWNNSVSNGIAFTPAGSGSYIVTGINTGTGCSSTASVTVTVNPLPVVAANASAATVCAGTAVALSGSGAATYNWDHGITDGVAFNASATTTYIVTGTTAAGCSATASVMVTVNPLPSVTANASATSVCEGATVTLTGGGASTYSWDHGVTDGFVFNPSATTTYIVTGTTVAGCSATNSVTITVNPLPSVVANASATAICAGSGLTLSGSGADTYSWDNGITDGITFNPSATQTYMVTGTATSGCTAMDIITVIVNPLPTVVANASATTICEGTTVTLTGSGAAAYTWDHGVTDGLPFSPSATATYIVTGTTAAGCSATNNITVTVNSLPSVEFTAFATPVCISGGIQTLDGGTPAGGVYSGTGVSAGTFDPSAGAGNYLITYNYTAANGCASSDTASITVSLCTGVENLALSDNISVYPNPSNGAFTVVYNNALHADLIIRISDVQGKIVAAETQKDFSGTYTNTFDLSGYSKGLYLLEICSNGQVAHKKFVLQ